MVTVSIDNEKCHDCHDTGTTPDLVYLHESNQWVEDGVRKCHCQEQMTLVVPVIYQEN
jgi:hypothetical protein